MSHRPKRQTGATLLVVLSLLAITSVMALGALQSALVDERLAGNLVAMSRAQLAAEWGAAQQLGRMTRHDSTSHGAADSLTCRDIRIKELDESDSGLQAENVRLSSEPRVGYLHGGCDSHGEVGYWVMGWVSNGEAVVARHLVLLVPELTLDSTQGSASDPAPDSNSSAASTTTPSMLWIDGGFVD
ncbi:pilus assembly PilX family protein [Halomonas cupida]|uniref:pilus assembly PilX family protein n=1 Tax=Halomonas cupida TaxID=44933 RepID=UPI003A95459B